MTKEHLVPFAKHSQIRLTLTPQAFLIYESPSSRPKISVSVSKEKKSNKKGSVKSPKKTGVKKAVKKKAVRKKNRKTATNVAFAGMPKQLKKIQTALNAARMGVWEWTFKTNKVKWSDQVHTIFGVTQDKFDPTLEGYIKLIHPDDVELVSATIQKTLTNNTNYFIHHRIILPSGAIRWLEGVGKVILRKGKAIALTGTVQDITNFKTEALEKEDWKTRFQLIASSSGLVIYDYNIITGKIIWSGNVAEVLGYTADEMGDIDKWVELIHRSDRPNAIAELEQAEKNLSKYNVVYRFLNKKGDYIYMQDQGFFTPNASGKAIRMLGVMMDISERLQSAQSYRDLFDSVDDAIFIQDTNGVFIDVNMGACRLSGYSKEEYIGKTPADFSIDELNDPQLPYIHAPLAMAGTPQRFKWWARRKNGDKLLKEISMIKGSYFGKTVLIATARDITEQQYHIDALQESELRFRTLQEASHGGIALHDKGIIIDCNQGLTNITGYTYDELIGSNGLNLIAPEYVSMVMEKIKSGYALPYDAEGIRKDGSRYNLEIHGRNIPFHGRTIRVTEFRDISDRKRAEEKILEQNARLQSVADELKRKNEQLEEFTQIVSHNLRSPVGNILTLLNFFEDAESSQERTEYLKLLKQAGSNTLNTLNELNEVLKIKQNKNIEKQELTFEKIFLQVKTMLSAQITEIDAQVKYDFSQAPHLLYSSIYLESIMLNLLSNALKYHSPKRKPEISFTTYVNGNQHLILEVTDNGLGINLDRYAHQLFKLRKTFHRHPESRGIGLFMIKNQIEAMGGDITVASKEDEGSTFIVTLTKDPNHDH